MSACVNSHHGMCWYLVEPPLVAARQPDQQPPHVVRHVSHRDEAGEIERATDRRLPVVPVARKSRADQHVRRPCPRQGRPRRRDEVVQHASRVVAKRDARHGVVDVAVEPGEEPESVLSGEQLAAVDGAVGHRDAAGFAAEDRLALEDANLEAPFSQLVRGAQTTDATAQNGHCLSHACLLSGGITPAGVNRKRGRETDRAGSDRSDPGLTPKAGGSPRGMIRRLEGRLPR